jgi:hypothetical protein
MSTFKLLKWRNNFVMFLQFFFARESYPHSDVCDFFSLVAFLCTDLLYKFTQFFFHG